MNNSIQSEEHVAKIGRKAFTEEVEILAQPGNNYLEAIAKVCDIHDIEIEYMSFYVQGTLKALVEQEAIGKRLLTKDCCENESAVLPL